MNVIGESVIERGRVCMCGGDVGDGMGVDSLTGECG